MNSKASTLKSSIANLMRRQGIESDMEQNLVKEAIHLHLLSAMSEAGILRHAVFQGGTALRLCYHGERYSEDLDFVCGKAGAYFTDVEFKELIEAALETIADQFVTQIVPALSASVNPSHCECCSHGYA